MQHCKSAKIQKKKIKKSGEGGCLRMHWHRGGGVYLQHIATLVWFVVGGFGKGYTRQRQARRYIAKMKIKGLNIILIKLSTVCYLTCDIFMFVYKLYR